MVRASREPAPSRERLVLAPGVRAVPLGRRLVQIGLEHRGAIRLPRTQTTEGVLTALAGGTPLPDDAASTMLLAELADRGLVVPGDRPAGSGVAVLGDAPLDPDPLLAAAGLSRAAELRGSDLALLLAAGELDRELLIPLLRTQRPHLPVRLLDGCAILGPFAVPGRSACLHCVDLHRTAEDAAHPLIVDRYARDPSSADLVLATLATAWAVRDLATWASGGCPSTWSRTVRVEPLLGEVSVQDWRRHPECGCTWGQVSSATMEA